MTTNGFISNANSIVNARLTVTDLVVTGTSQMEDVTVLSLTARSNVNVTGNVNTSFVNSGAAQINLLNSNSVFLSEILHTNIIDCTGNATISFATILGD